MIDGAMEVPDFAHDTRDRLARIETRMDSFATKADLHQALNAQTWRLISWSAGAGASLVAVAYYIARNIN